MFGVTVLPGAWNPWVLMPPLAHAVSAAATRAGSTAAVALAAKAALPGLSAQPVGQVMCVLAEWSAARSAAGAAGSSSSAAAPSGAASSALTRLGASADAVRVIGEMHQIDMASETGGDEMRRLARAAEMDSSYGVDIATILHAESLAKMPTGDASLHYQTREVWKKLSDIRPRLAVARRTHYRVYAPSAVSLPTLIAAVNTGVMTIEVVSGSKPADSADLKMRRLAHAWPLLMALVHDVTPRDADAGATLLKFARDAFDLAMTSAPQALELVKPLLAELAERAEHFKDGVTRELGTWDASLAEATRRRMAAAAAAGSSGSAATDRAVADSAKALKAVGDMTKQMALRQPKAGAGADATAADAAASGAPAGSGEQAGGTPKKKQRPSE